MGRTRHTVLRAIRSAAVAKSTETGTTLCQADVAPRLGALALGALIPGGTSAFYSSLLESGARGRPLGAKSVRGVQGVLRKALGDAVRWGRLVATQPTSFSRRPSHVAR